MDKLADNKICGDADCSRKSELYSGACSIICLLISQKQTFSSPHSVFCSLSDVLSMATALDDFIAPDCRFINIKKGQIVYVYSKLVPEEGAGVFWSGSVCVYFLSLVTKSHSPDKQA